jgi:hypothetical protein
MCSLARNVAQADASMRAGKWERGKYVGVSLVDKTLAVMGFGKVGGARRGGVGAARSVKERSQVQSARRPAQDRANQERSAFAGAKREAAGAGPR